MNKFESWEDNSIIYLDIKSEMDIKDEPCNSDSEFHLKNEVDFTLEEHQEQISNSTKNIVSGKMDKAMFETVVQQIGIEHVKQENNEHSTLPEVHNINSHLDKESVYPRIQKSKFSKVLDRRPNEEMEFQKSFTEEQGFHDILPLASLNSSIRDIKDESDNEKKDISVEASTSQEKIQLLNIFRCSVCRYETDQKEHLNIHLLTHLNTKLYKCSECDYECNWKSHLKQHLFVHSKIKLFKCSECSYQCNRKETLTQHLLTHSNTKLFKCAECEYECIQKSNLKRHILIHSNTKLFKCSICDYECIQKCRLNEHLLKHSSLKLFKCVECSYECNQKRSLKRHLLIHSNIKLFKCSECNYECNRRCSLKKHFLIHSNTNNGE